MTRSASWSVSKAWGLSARSSSATTASPLWHFGLPQVRFRVFSRGSVGHDEGAGLKPSAGGATRPRPAEAGTLPVWPQPHVNYGAVRVDCTTASPCFSQSAAKTAIAIPWASVTIVCGGEGVLCGFDHAEGPCRMGAVCHRYPTRTGEYLLCLVGELNGRGDSGVAGSQRLFAGRGLWRSALLPRRHARP